MRRMAFRNRTLGSDLVTSRPSTAQQSCAIRETSMLDLLMLILGLGFFAAAIGYTYACERL
jgi:hypothetical protein